MSTTTADERQFLPDPSKTPGDTLDVTKDDVCVSGYSSKVRNVPQEVKNQAYAEYGITHHEPGEYEIDHLISLELGGSNSLKNLWPQSYKTQPWNAHVKDKLENRLHEMICNGEIDMKTAQQEIATDWIAAYKKYVGSEPASSGDHTRRRSHSREGGERGTSSPTRQETPAEAQSSGGTPSGGSDEQVWVNTRSGVYWRQGTEYYGKTREGKYMTEREALQQGYHPPGGR
jgi:hypothetical protein